VNIQASGGKAIDITIAALDRINKEIPLTAMRPVIIHSQFPSEQNMKDAARIGIVLTVPLGQIKEIKVLATLVGGREVYGNLASIR